MRVAFILTLFICLGCNTENVDLDKNYDKAVSYYNTDIKTCESHAIEFLNSSFSSKDYEGVGKFAYLLGVVNSRNGKYLKSTEYFLLSNHYYTKVGDDKNGAKSLIELGYVNNQLKNYNISKSGLKEVLKSNLDEAQIKKAYDYLARAYIGLNEKDSAIGIIERNILDISNKIGLSASIYTTAGFLYLEIGDYAPAIEYLNKSISLDNTKENLACCYNNLSYIYLKKNELDKAMLLANKSISYNVSDFQSQAYRTRALISIEKKNYQSVEEDLKASIKYKRDYSVIANAYEKMAKAFKEKGNTTESSKYFELQGISLKEKLRLESEQNIEAREAREAIYNHNNQKLLAQLDKKDQVNTYIMVLFGIIVLLVGYIYLIKRKNRIRLVDEANNIAEEARKDLRKKN